MVAFFRGPAAGDVAGGVSATQPRLGRHALPWLLPLLYVLLALTLVAWAGVRHSNRTRRGRALFVFTVGIVLIVLASAFFLLRAVGTTRFVGVGAAATLLGCAMLVVAAGSLLPSVEDWFGARRGTADDSAAADELGRRHPDVGIGVRPRGPLVFRVAERMSLISDALFLEATAADGAWRPVDTAGSGSSMISERTDRHADLETPASVPGRTGPRVAEWIQAGRGSTTAARRGSSPAHLAAPADTYSDREWILAIAMQYRQLDRGGDREPP